MLNPEDQVEVIIAYHADCMDGFTAAYIVAKAMKQAEKSYCLVPMHYDEASYDSLLAVLEAQQPTELFVVDFSLEISTLCAIQDTHCNLDVVILDHHKTAFERYCPEVTLESNTIWVGHIEGAHIILNNQISGAHVAWRYFHPELTAPRLVTYVSDYDLWRFQYGVKTKQVNKYLRSIPMTLESWHVMEDMLSCKEDRATIFMRGAELLAEHDAQVLAISTKAVPMQIGGYLVPTVACDYEFASDVGHILAKALESQTFAAMFTPEVAKGRIKWSLRSEGDFDVSAVAKRHGGGGHKNAAGFYTDLLPELAKPSMGVNRHG